MATEVSVELEGIQSTYQELRRRKQKIGLLLLDKVDVCYIFIDNMEVRMDEQLREQGTKGRWRVFGQDEKALEQVVCKKMQVLFSSCFVRLVKYGLPKLQDLLQIIRDSAKVLLVSAFKP